MTISQEQIDSYRRDGHVIVENVVAEEELDALRKRTDQIATGEVPIRSKASSTSRRPKVTNVRLRA